LAPHATLAQSSEPEGGIWSKDKQGHIAASAIVSSLLYTTMRNRKMGLWRSYATSITLTLTIGLVKEMTDPAFSTADMGANAIGAIGGSTLVLTIDAAFL
jgi:hypothetical protein